MVNPSKPVSIFTGTPIVSDIASGPKSTYSYIKSPLKLEFALNLTFCLVPSVSGFDGFHYMFVLTSILYIIPGVSVIYSPVSVNVRSVLLSLLKI